MSSVTSSHSHILNELNGENKEIAPSMLMHMKSNSTYHISHSTSPALASCLIYAQALLEYVIFILWVRSVTKVLPSVKFAEYKVLTFLILCEKCSKQCNSESNLNPKPNFQSRLIR